MRSVNSNNEIKNAKGQRTVSNDSKIYAKQVMFRIRSKSPRNQLFKSTANQNNKASFSIGGSGNGNGGGAGGGGDFKFLNNQGSKRE